MTSFKPLWTSKAADCGEDGVPSVAQAVTPGSPAPVAFEPLWLGGGKRNFVVTQPKAGGSAPKNAEPGAEHDGRVPAQEQAAASAAPEDPEINEVSTAAVQNTNPVPQDDPQAALAAFAPASPAVPMITCEEHARLLEIERAAGMEAGRLEGRAEAAGIIEAEREKMRAYIASIEAGFGNSAEFFAPLKKLALHIAQQLVRGELQSSGVAVSRLIDHCLAGAGERRPLAVRVHPQDREMFAKLRGDDDAGLRIVTDASFAPGSVRVEFDDGWIEDMMQDRVEEVARALHAGSAGDADPASLES